MMIEVSTKDAADNERLSAISIASLTNKPTLPGKPFACSAKGRHPAALNFGDCFSYALARSLADTLLYKGADFGKCDIESDPASR